MSLFHDKELNLSPYDHKSNTEPLSYKMNDKNSRSKSLFILKCELLFQMTEQSYTSLFTLTIGFIPVISHKLCIMLSYSKFY